jgi:hypothetical protein
MSQTKLHNHTELQDELQFCIPKFLCFYTADEKTKDFGLNGGEHSFILFCSGSYRPYRALASSSVL